MFFSAIMSWQRKEKPLNNGVWRVFFVSQLGLFAKQELPFQKEKSNKKGCARGIEHPNLRNLSVSIMLVRGQKEVSKPCYHRAMSLCFYFILV
jgi:hypothetical protein